jgi:hypothetical protein
VYGWLAREAIPRATTLIWLDLPVEGCIANLRRREGLRDRDAASFTELLAWAGDYPQRQTSSSFAGHERLFAAFPVRKLRLRSKPEVTAFLAEVGGPHGR